MSERGIPVRPVAVLGLGMLGLGLAVGGFGAYVSALIARGVDPGVAGLGSTLFLLGQLVIVYPTDVVSRRWSVRYAAAGGLVLGAAGTALGGSLSVPVHLGSRLLLGLGMGATFLAAMTYGGLRAPDGTTARVQGLLGALFTLGFAAGIAVMPAAVDRFGPTLPTVAASLPVACSALVAVSLEPVTIRPTVPARSYLRPFRDAFGVSLGLANAASYGLLIVATTWYTDVVAGAPALPAGLVLTGFAAATFLGRTGSGWLTVLTTERRAVGGSLVALTLALALVAGAIAVGSEPLLGGALILTGFGFGLPFGPLFSLAFGSSGTDAGVLLVWMTALGNAAALVYPWLVGWLLGATGGYLAGFVVMALSVLAVAVFWEWAVVRGS